MTDELSIQPQVQQKSNALPYALGGAVVGAAGGYFTPMVQKKYSSYEEILKESEDTFKKQIEKGGDNKTAWETAKTHAEKLNNAEAEYNKLVEQVKTEGASVEKSLPADNAAAKKLEAAKKAYDAEMTKLVDAETRKLGTGSATAEIAAKDIKPFSKITTEQLPTEYAFGKQKGKKIPGAQVESLYNSLTGNLVAAENALDVNLNNGLRKQKAGYTINIASSFNSAIADTAKMSDDKIVDYFNNKTTWSILGGTKPTPQYARALNIAKSYYPDFTTLTNEQFMALGTELKPGEKTPKGMTTKTITVKDPVTKRLVTKNIYFDPAAYDSLKEAEIKRIADLRTTAADQIFAETQKAVSIKKQITDFANNFEKTIARDLADGTGLYNASADSLNVTQIIAEGKGGVTYGTGSKAVKGYAADIQNLMKAKNAGATKLPAGLNGNYAGATIDEAIKQAQARNSVFKSYNKQYEALVKQFDECLKNNPIIQEFDAKIVDAMNKDKALTKARQQLAEQFPGIFTAKPTMAAEEITAKAKEAANKAIEGKDVAKALETAKKEAATAAKDLGVKAELTGEELTKALKEKGLGTLEEYKSKLKEEAKKAIGEDLSKFKTPNKWANAAIGAAVLAAAGLGIAAATSKKNA